LHPEFPEFKPIELEDREAIQTILDGYKPETSEWTFTNLFIWRSRYRFRWCRLGGHLLILCAQQDKEPYFLQPVGVGSRIEVVRTLLRWLREEKESQSPRIERADQRLASELEAAQDLTIQPDRDQFDYVYRTEDLIKLAGKQYHSKKNHLNRFSRTHVFKYAPLTQEHVKACSKLAETWCQWRRCEEDMNLLDEWEAVEEALRNLTALKLKGGVILIDGRVEAFTLGELLNQQTAVVHIEKANPEIPELFAVVNQQFCENAWQDVSFVNREQDLGEAGLRKAKLSYHPNHLAEKFRIELTEAKAAGSVSQ
jgi:hypothetical protein